MRSTTGTPSGELQADYFIAIHHGSPFLRVQANCWGNFLCYFVSNPMPQFSQFPLTFLHGQKRSRGGRFPVLRGTRPSFQYRRIRRRMSVCSPRIPSGLSPIRRDPLSDRAVHLVHAIVRAAVDSDRAKWLRFRLFTMVDFAPTTCNAIQSKCPSREAGHLPASTHFPDFVVNRHLALMSLLRLSLLQKCSNEHNDDRARKGK
jgi:hypothetical protein